jgi:hypothetical protein
MDVPPAATLELSFRDVLCNNFKDVGGIKQDLLHVTLV